MDPILFKLDVFARIVGLDPKGRLLRVVELLLNEHDDSYRDEWDGECLLIQLQRARELLALAD